MFRKTPSLKEGPNAFFLAILFVFKQTLYTFTTFLTGASNITKNFFHANSFSDV